MRDALRADRLGSSSLNSASSVPPVAVSPFARHQLFRNPFGELTRAERAEIALVEVEPLIARVQRADQVLQIIGPCGHGKTTHLLAIERALPQSGYVYFPEDLAQPPLPTVRPLLVDEAQRMGWRRLRELAPGSGPLAISTHVDLAKRFRRQGFEVHTLDLAVPIAASRLQVMLNGRITAAAVGLDAAFGAEPGAGVDAEVRHLFLSHGQVVALQQRFGSNIRRIEHHLYEVFQRFAEKGEPWPPVI